MCVNCGGFRGDRGEPNAGLGTELMGRTHWHQEAGLGSGLDRRVPERRGEAEGAGRPGWAPAEREGRGTQRPQGGARTHLLEGRRRALWAWRPGAAGWSVRTARARRAGAEAVGGG